MKLKPTTTGDHEFAETWMLPYTATLGSTIRLKGIFLELRAQLPLNARKALKIVPGGISLRMALSREAEFRAASLVVSKSLIGIENLPVIPREIQDILSITSTERHRWLKDGRLPSAGMRTVKLRGRAKKVTFHVFEPSLVERLLDGDIITEWREVDAETAARNRAQAAWKRKLARSTGGGKELRAQSQPTKEGDGPKLRGWEEFERNGPLR